MNNAIKSYLSGAQRSVRNQMIGIDGHISDDLYVTNDSVFSADGETAPEMGSGAGMPVSQPYIIQVSNASAAAVSNFDVLGAFQYLQNTGFSNGSLTISGITISSGLPNITYQEFLNQSLTSPFTVGLTYLSCATAGQILTPFTVNTRDANGNQGLRPITPVIDPYQQQSTVLAVKQPYRIDGFTKLTFSTILASAVLTVMFYPSDNINIGRGLQGKPVSAQFGNPNVVKSSVAVIGGDTVKARLG